MSPVTKQPGYFMIEVPPIDIGSPSINITDLHDVFITDPACPIVNYTLEFTEDYENWEPFSHPNIAITG